MKRQKTTQVEGEANEKAYTVKGTHLQSKHSRCVGTGSGESPQPNKIQGVSKKQKRRELPPLLDKGGGGQRVVLEIQKRLTSPGSTRVRPLPPKGGPRWSQH